MTRPLIRLALLAFLLAAFPGAAPAATAPRDPRAGLLRRMDRYFQQNEVDGVVLDARWVLNETEAVRLSVIPQLLGYAELERRHPRPRFARDVRDRADYLVERLELVRSGGVFDGMLGDALLEAYEVTGDARHLAAARSILDELDALPQSDRILNGGLMAAMAFAREFHRTGDPFYRQEVEDILAGLGPYQHPDGSFPHWCPCSRDVHYTDWMAQELILIGRLVDDPRIEPMLARMNAFMEERVGPDGVTSYTAPCPWDPGGCLIVYWSYASGCNIDYDTRGFTNELGYTALLFDHFHAPEYGAVLRFTDSLEDGGVFADKWDYPIPQSDPYWPWTSADTSVVNMSLLFWSLAAIPPGQADDDLVRGTDEDERQGEGPPARRAARRLEADTEAALGDRWPRPAGTAAAFYCDDAPATVLVAPPSPLAIAAVTPNPGAGAVAIRLALPLSLPARVTIHDVRGRLVRAFEVPAGTRDLSWDGRDAAGHACTRGVYFVDARAGEDRRSSRLVLTGAR